MPPHAERRHDNGDADSRAHDETRLDQPAGRPLSLSGESTVRVMDYPHC
jgi:hypothetical protein